MVKEGKQKTKKRVKKTRKNLSAFFLLCYLFHLLFFLSQKSGTSCTIHQQFCFKVFDLMFLFLGKVLKQQKRISEKKRNETVESIQIRKEERTFAITKPPTDKLKNTCRGTIRDKQKKKNIVGPSTRVCVSGGRRNRPKRREKKSKRYRRASLQENDACVGANARIMRFLVFFFGFKNTLCLRKNIKKIQFKQ